MARGQQATQLVVPVFEGQRLDRYRITFAGSLELDPTDPDDLDLINRLKLGEEVTLRVEGAIVSRGRTTSPGTRKDGSRPSAAAARSASTRWICAL
jgi:hypothetical protein